MALRITQRIMWVGLTYGIGPGLLSVPRLIVGNILNGLASLRALNQFAASRAGKARVAWDNTAHLEGIGDKGGEPTRKAAANLEGVPLDQILLGLNSKDNSQVITSLKTISPDLYEFQRAEVVHCLRNLITHPDLTVRASLAQTLGRLPWSELTPTLFRVLQDSESAVVLNAARSLLGRPRLGPLLEEAFTICEYRTVDALVRMIEQDRKRQRFIFEMIGKEHLVVTRTRIMAMSPFLKKRYENYLESITSDPRGPVSNFNLDKPATDTH